MVNAKNLSYLARFLLAQYFYFITTLCVAGGESIYCGKDEEGVESYLSAHVNYQQRVNNIYNVVDPITQKEILIVSTFFVNSPDGEPQSSVSVLGCHNGNLFSLAEHHFYAKKVERINYDKVKSRIAIIFVYETELHGWLEWGDKNYQFLMFEDPEL